MGSRFFEKRVHQKYISIRVVVSYNKKGNPVRINKRLPLGTSDKQLNIEALKIKDAYAQYYPNNLTLEMLIKEFLEWKADKVSPRTIYNYRREMPSYLKSDLKLSELTKKNCQALIQGSPRRRTKTKTYLNQILNYAVDNDYIHQSPGKLDAFASPKRMKTIRVLSKNEIHLLLAETSKYSLLYEFLLSSGLRIGEALALEPKHVQGNAITVAQSVNFLYGRQIGELKTSHSYRTVSIPEATAVKLKKYGRFVFSYNYTVICKDFRKVRERLGLHGATLHSLRHTHCTQLLARGISPVAVSKRLGHHSAAFTLDRYAHLVPEMNEGLLDAVKDLIY